MNISIFYNQNLWHHLIKTVIDPILKAKELKHPSLYLRKSQGHHIILAIPTTQAVSVTDKYLNQIHNYINFFPSKDEIISYPLNGFFMDYPNNSIFINIEDVNFKNEFYQLRYVVSQCIVKALCELEINDSKIVTFILYMQLGLLKVNIDEINLINESIEQILLRISNSKHASYFSEERSGITSYDIPIIGDSISLENMSGLREIVYEVFEIENANDDLLWLKNWIQYCKSLKHENFAEFFISISQVICEQVGLESEFTGRMTLNLITTALKV